MLKTKIYVKNRLGICARPACDIVQTAMKYKSSLFLEVVTESGGSKRVDCRSIMSVMMLGACSGTELFLIAEGKDEQMVTDEIIFLFDKHFVKKYNEN